MQAIEPHLYNSRITQTYIDYLRATYPDLKIDKILQKSGMTKDELADDAHWFTQSQVDRFHEVLVAETGDKNIARHAGRFVASAQGLNLLKQYVIGLINIETVFASMTKIIPLFTKGATVTVQKLGQGKIAISSMPNPGVNEKLYQCDNRMGYFEALPKLFTYDYAQIEHPECFHRGDPFCQYIVSWRTSLSLKLRLIRNYSFLVSLLLLIGLCFSLPAIPLFNTVALLILFNLLLSIVYAHQKNKELEKVIESHHKMAAENLEAVNTNYNNALLVQEIGQATAAIFDVHELMNKLALLMKRRLSFDRGMILLADENEKHLIYSAGYGYDEVEKKHLEQTEFRLTNTGSKGVFVRAFLDQKHIVVNNINEIKDTLSAKSQKLAKYLSVRSFLCVPILFEKKSLGILAVDNIRSMALLKKNDVNLLQGITSHIAISIYNSRSFQKLRESEDKYRQTLESIEEGYFELDYMNTIISVNNALCELLDYTINELIGDRFDHHFFPDNIHRMEELFKRIQKDGTAVRFAHFKMVRKAGDLIPVDLSASLVLDTSGRPIGFRGVIRDATDRLNAEKEKKLLEDQLLQAQKMEAIGTLAGGIAHNFNNWLSSILGNATLIQMDSQQNEKIIERANKIESIVESAAQMTQQLLGYAREGKIKVGLIDVNKVIQDSADTFSIARKDITIHLNLDPNLKAVKADKSQIEQVLWNLYINAVDAMPSGGKLAIETKNTTSQELKGYEYEITSGDYICFSVSDSGIGMNPEQQKNIFEPFFTTKNGKGTGLGLASVYGIIKSHNGYIDVKSSKGKGSTFSISLPSAKEDFVTGQPSEHHIIGGKFELILLVDDDETVLDTISQLLRSLGYSTLSTPNGQEALEIYETKGHLIDLVIIDMIMPGMNGSELFDQLKERNPNIKTLLSSGYSLNEQAQQIMDHGCNGFIQKPFNLTQLAKMIRKILSSSIS